MAQKQHLIRWIPAISWGLIILVLSLMPGGTGGFTFFGIPHFDKIGHFGMYAGWTFFILLALRGQQALPREWQVGAALLTGVGLGIILEFGQKWMHQGRSFELWDMLANATGAMAGVGVFLLFFAKK